MGTRGGGLTKYRTTAERLAHRAPDAPPAPGVDRMRWPHLRTIGKWAAILLAVDVAAACVVIGVSWMVAVCAP